MWNLQKNFSFQTKLAKFGYLRIKFLNKNSVWEQNWAAFWPCFWGKKSQLFAYNAACGVFYKIVVELPFFTHFDPIICNFCSFLQFFSYFLPFPNNFSYSLNFFSFSFIFVIFFSPSIFLRINNLSFLAYFNFLLFQYFHFFELSWFLNFSDFSNSDFTIFLKGYLFPYFFKCFLNFRDFILSKNFQTFPQFPNFCG